MVRLDAPYSYYIYVVARKSNGSVHSLLKKTERNHGDTEYTEKVKGNIAVLIHEAQLLTYLRLSGKKVGLLMNFNIALMKDGIKRMVF